MYFIFRAYWSAQKTVHKMLWLQEKLTYKFCQ